MLNSGKQKARTNFKISERKDILRLMQRINESRKQIIYIVLYIYISSVESKILSGSRERETENEYIINNYKQQI